MKKYILPFLFWLFFASLLIAQEINENKNVSSKAIIETRVKDFSRKKDLKYNDWSISFFGGINAMQNADLVSWYDKKFKELTPGYDLQFSINRQLTHAFGISLQGQYGETRQKGMVDDLFLSKYAGLARAKTTYYGISLMSDVNFSNLLRRSEYTYPFRWSFHGYLGFGILGYDAKRNNYLGSGEEYVTVTKQDIDDKSFYAQLGFGLRKKLNSRIDAELKAMYFVSGDEEFDGSGRPYPGHITAADYKPNRSDDMITVSLGVHYKFGKHDESLQWVDPLKGLKGGDTIINQGGEDFVCIDEDDDGVCDQWDKCLGTPAGYIVDGSGCALDVDKDGVPDSIDKCPTIAGPPENEGCPEKVVRVVGGEVASIVTKAIEGIEFDYNSDRIRPVSYEKLNNAVKVLLENPDLRFYVEGHTDAAGSAQYNLQLSERRANSVIRFLAAAGVRMSNLIAVGMGKNDLKWPECDPVTNCPAWKNLENRRVVFKEIN